MKVDYFVTLGQARRADLDDDAIRKDFQRLSRKCHPDAGGQLKEFEELNQAHAILSDVVSRLRHLYELEFGKFPAATGAFSAQAMELFAVVGEVVSGANDYIHRKSRATTAISRALIAREEEGIQRSVLECCGEVRVRRGELLSRLTDIDSKMADDRDSARVLVEESCHELAFLAKWERQLNECMATLVL